MRTATHFANPDLVLEIIKTYPGTGYRGEGIPAVLREPGYESWFSAELFEEQGHEVAYFVNGYGDEGSARSDAYRRSRR